MLQPRKHCLKALRAPDLESCLVQGSFVSLRSLGHVVLPLLYPEAGECGHRLPR